MRALRGRLAELPLAELAPRDDDHAREWLAGRIGREMERLTEIRSRLQRIADADLAEAPARLAFETGPEGERHRRYILSNERLVNRTIDEFLKVRKATLDGPLSVVRCPLQPNPAGSGPAWTWARSTLATSGVQLPGRPRSTASFRARTTGTDGPA